MALDSLTKAHRNILPSSHTLLLLGYRYSPSCLARYHWHPPDAGIAISRYVCTPHASLSPGIGQCSVVGTTLLGSRWREGLSEGKRGNNWWFAAPMEGHFSSVTFRWWRKAQLHSAPSKPAPSLAQWAAAAAGAWVGRSGSGGASRCLLPVAARHIPPSFSLSGSIPSVGTRGSPDAQNSGEIPLNLRSKC